jgi:hypothetical protein
MWQRLHHWIKNYNIFIKENDQDDDITDAASADNKRKLQLYATRLYIILFIGEITC